VQVCRPENFCAQVWTAHEAGRAASVKRVASRATPVRIRDCMYGEVESFICVGNGKAFWKKWAMEERERAH
jgi:hypothetical protein